MPAPTYRTRRPAAGGRPAALRLATGAVLLTAVALSLPGRVSGQPAGQPGPGPQPREGNILVTDITFSPDGKTVATIDERGAIHLHDVAGKTTRILNPAKDVFVHQKVRFTADGRWLVCGSRYGVQVLDATTGEPHAKFGDTASNVLAPPALISPDGKQVVTVDRLRFERRNDGKGWVYDANVKVWDIATKANVHTVTLGDWNANQAGWAGYSPDGRTVAVIAGRDLALIDTTTGKHVRLKDVVDGTRLTPAWFTPDGKQLLLFTGANDQVQPISLANPEAPRLLAPFRGPTFAHTGKSQFTPDGTRWYVPEGGGWLGWKLVDRASLKTLAEFPNTQLFALSADGKTAVLSNGVARQVVILDATTGKERGFLPFADLPFRGMERRIPVGLTHLTVSPTGEHVAYTTGGHYAVQAVAGPAAGRTGTTATAAPLPKQGDNPLGVGDILIAKDGGAVVLVGASRSSPTVVVDGRTLQPRAVIRDPFRPEKSLPVRFGAVAADGATGLFVADVLSADGRTETPRSLVHADLKTGKTRVLDARNIYEALAVSPDGKHLAAVVFEPNKPGRVISQSNGGKVVTLLDGVKWGAHSSPLLAVSDDGKWVCGWVQGKGEPTRDEPWQTLVWDTSTGEAGAVAGNPTPSWAGGLDRSYPPTYPIAFLPDSKAMTLVTGRDVAVYDAATGRQVRKHENVSRDMPAIRPLVVLSPAGDSFVVAGGTGGELFLKSAETGELKARLAGHTDVVHAARFSPDGRRLITVSLDNTVRSWDVPAK
jgi:WD40 repeat protein